MNEEEIEDGVFEEINERGIILTKDLSEEDLKKIEDSETAVISPEDAAAFAQELEAAQNEVKTIQATDGDQRPLTQAEMMDAINNAAGEGMISKSRKARIMQEMGIFKSEFTKKHTPKSAKVKKRKAAKNARKKNRK